MWDNEKYKISDDARQLGRTVQEKAVNGWLHPKGMTDNEGRWKRQFGIIDDEEWDTMRNDKQCQMTDNGEWQPMGNNKS